MFQPGGGRNPIREIGCLWCAIMGSASTLNITSASLSSSNACTAVKSIPARVSGWPCARRLWNVTQEPSGWNHKSARERFFISPCHHSRTLDMNEAVIDILLVEDNPGDARLTMEAFKEAKVANRLS